MRLRFICLLSSVLVAGTAFGQNTPKYTCDFYTEGGVTLANDGIAPSTMYMKYGFGATFNKNLSDKFSVGIGFTGIKNVTANSYSVPIYVNMEYRVLGNKPVSPVLFAKAGYSLFIPAQIATRDICETARYLDYKWSDLLYKDGKYKAYNDKGEEIDNIQYSRALYIKDLYGYEDDFDGVYYTYPDEYPEGLTPEQIKALQKEIDAKNQAMQNIILRYDYSSIAFASGDRYYVNEWRTFAQRGAFIAVGLGVDFKLSSSIVGLYANVGLSDHFVGSIVSENNVYHYYDAIDYLNKVEKNASGKKIGDIKGDAGIIEGFSHHFYPQANISLRVRFW